MLVPRCAAIGLAVVAVNLGAPYADPFAAEHALLSRAGADDACALLTLDQVSAAIDVKALPGQHLVASAPSSAFGPRILSRTPIIAG